MQSQCWIAETRGGPGYGWWSSREHGVRGYAHRISYEFFSGPIPEGLSLDHLCKNKACYNPRHLEPVTHQENCKRAGPDRRKTHCKHGHELMYYEPINAQKCITCERRRQADYLRRKQSGNRELR